MGARANWAVVVDFDGTICPNDVAEEILQAFAGPEWWKIDLEFRRKEIGSRECLTRQCALLKGSQREMLAFVLDSFAIQPSFAPFVRWAHDRGIEVTVASDGMGFYIEPMLAAGGVPEVPILANDVRITADGPSFAFPSGSPDCIGCGTCKMNAVLRARAGGRPVAFVGEGHSDRYGALYSDLVFAKDHLVGICQEDAVPFVVWETFDDVRRTLSTTDVRTVAAQPERRWPERCPGWRDPVGAWRRDGDLNPGDS